MSKFNQKDSEMTVNKCGFEAYKMDPKSKLISQVLTSFFNEKKFYGDNSEELVSTLKDVIRTNPEFVSKLAIFARHEFNMRSVSHVLAGYLANIPEGKPYVRQTVKNIVLRGDDATEILAFYLNTFGKPIPNSLRKALRDVFETFDEYTLAKYKGNGPVKMKDILCLTHPSPKSVVTSQLWKDLLEDKLMPAYTWESQLSAKGNTKETWEQLIASGKVGYMALLRNLRNIIKANPDNMQKVLDKLSDANEVWKSKQLPFRFLSAYRSIPRNENWSADKAYDAIDTAADYSVSNLPKIPGKTVIAIDVSGSMCCHISARSDIRCSDIALLLGVIANRICESARVFTFDTSIEELNIRRKNGIISTAMNLRANGGGTNMYLPFEKMLHENIDCDRVIILSDNECNSVGWYDHRTVQEMADQYREETGNDIWMHAIDLEGYGTQQFKGPKTNMIAGWSEKVFEFIRLAEEGTDSLVNRIAHYQPFDHSCN